MKHIVHNLMGIISSERPVFNTILDMHSHPIDKHDQADLWFFSLAKCQLGKLGKLGTKEFKKTPIVYYAVVYLSN